MHVLTTSQRGNGSMYRGKEIKTDTTKNEEKSCKALSTLIRYFYRVDFLEMSVVVEITVQKE